MRYIDPPSIGRLIATVNIAVGVACQRMHSARSFWIRCSAVEQDLSPFERLPHDPARLITAIEVGEREMNVPGTGNPNTGPRAASVALSSSINQRRRHPFALPHVRLRGAISVRGK
jgi:hypothetical protein